MRRHAGVAVNNDDDRHSARRPRRRPGENRERLLEAGITEFGNLGYAASSTAVIAARADVPQPHVYANFQTKEDLFYACTKRVTDELVRGSRNLRLELFLYQAVAALGGSAGNSLKQLLEPARLAMGDEEFAAALSRAAMSLLTEPLV